MNWPSLILAGIVTAAVIRALFEDRRYQRVIRREHDDFCKRVNAFRVNDAVNSVGQQVDQTVFTNRNGGRPA